MLSNEAMTWSLWRPVISAALLAGCCGLLTAHKYSPTWDSIDSRPLPAWYDDDKFGIFMHWGVYSYVGIGDAWFEYYWLREHDHDEVEFMRKNFKPNFTYADFAPYFTAEFYDPQYMAKLIEKAGAKYVVLTSKHHEGFTNWPSKYSWNWNSVDVGPNRDIVGELAEAVRKTSVKFGLYFSLYEWFHPLYLDDKKASFNTQAYQQAVMWPQIKELVNTYKPEVVWSDGDWEAPDFYWNSTGFLAWLYNESPVKDTVVTNDRWGAGIPCHHGGYYTCTDRFSPGVLQKHKWENCMTIDSQSWGFRRTMKIDEILTIHDLITELVKTVSCGGNLLMNVGPTHDGRIVPIFEERLTQMGQWLEVNGEAIYSSKPWIYQNDTITPDIWYTSQVKSAEPLPKRRIFNPQVKDNTVVYATFLTWPLATNQLLLGSVKSTPQTAVTMLGYTGAPLHFKQTPKGLVVDLSTIDWSKMKLLDIMAWVLKLDQLATVERTPNVYAPMLEAKPNNPRGNDKDLVGLEEITL